MNSRLLCALSLVFGLQAPLTFAQPYDPPVFESIFSRDIPNYIVLNQGLSRSGRANERGLQQLKRLGIATLLNIENNDAAIRWEAAKAREIGFRFFSRPMEWNSRPDDTQVNEILTMMQDKRLQPVLLHCKHGRDRTGMLVGLYRVFVDKWSPRKAYEEMLATGFRPQFKALDDYYRGRTGYRGP